MAVKLMLVEDDPALQRLYTDIFTRTGFDVIRAQDGTFVQETAKLDRPSIIVMDVMMPNFNGIDALQELKGNPATQTIPVIMLSAYNDEQLVSKALQAGAAHYVVKSSVEPDQLVAIVKEVLQLA